MAFNQFGAGSNVWKSDEHTLREIAQRRVRKFNINANDNSLSLNPQPSGQPLMDQLGEIFHSIIDDMNTDMANNNLVQFVM